MAKNILTHKLSEPLNKATTARLDINAGDGNLTIDRLTESGQLSGGEPMLASGTLQYWENQGTPTRSLVSKNGQVTLMLKGGRAGQPWFRMPWSACNGATEWQIHLNPMVSSDITAHSDGGNIKLDLAGMTVTRVSADTGGGNMDVILPEEAANMTVTAKTGAGNVLVSIPSGISARIQATTGLGKAIVDPRFNRIDKDTYQSPDFESALNKIDITAKSGAGNVIVTMK